MANVFLKFMFEEGRCQEVSLLLSEFISENTAPNNLEIVLKGNVVSVFYEANEEKRNLPVDLSKLFQIASNVEFFLYDVTLSEADREAKKDALLGKQFRTIAKEEVQPDNQYEEIPGQVSFDEIEKIVAETGDKAGVVIPEGGETIKKAPEEDPVEESTKKITAKQVLGIINGLPDENQEGIDANEIARMLGTKRTSVAFHLSHLFREKQIRKVARGKYHKLEVTSAEGAQDEAEAAEENKVQQDDSRVKLEITGDNGEADKPPFAEVIPKPAPPAVQVQEKPTQPRRFKSLEEVPMFSKIYNSLNFRLSRDENLKTVLDNMFREMEPSEEVKNDLTVRATVALVIVSEKVNWYTISLNLEEFETGVTEDTKKKTEKYLIELFASQGYEVSYIKFLVQLNKLFGMRYRNTELPFAKKPDKLRVKLECMPECREFEEFLGELTKRKNAGSSNLTEVAKYMGVEELPTAKASNILEVFRVSYTLKKITEDFLKVNGSYTISESQAIALTKGFIDSFVTKISGGEKSTVNGITFLKELNEALKSRI